MTPDMQAELESLASRAEDLMPGYSAALLLIRNEDGLGNQYIMARPGSTRAESVLGIMAACYHYVQSHHGHEFVAGLTAGMLAGKRLPESAGEGT